VRGVVGPAVELRGHAGTPRLAIRASGEQLDHAPHRIGPEEGGIRAAHDLDALQVLGRQVAEIERAARLVERYSVEQHLVVIALATAHEERRQRARRAAANDHGAWRLCQEIGEERRLAPLEIVLSKDRYARADLARWRHGPGRRHDHRFLDRRDGEHHTKWLAGGRGCAGNRRGLKAREAGLQVAAAGIARCHVEAAAFIREDAGQRDARFVEHAYIRAWHRAARLVHDRTSELACGRRRGSAAQQSDCEKNERKTGTHVGSFRRRSRRRKDAPGGQVS